MQQVSHFLFIKFCIVWSSVVCDARARKISAQFRSKMCLMLVMLCLMHLVNNTFDCITVRVTAIHPFG